MQGPQPPGTWTGRTPAQSYGPLVPATEYRVQAAFVDYDGATHPPGERWTYLGYGFLPYDDGLSLFVSLDGQQEWHIRLQDRPEEQADTIRAIHQGTLLGALSNDVPEIRIAALPLAIRWGWARWITACAGFGAVAGTLVGGALTAVFGSLVARGDHPRLALGALALGSIVVFASLAALAGWLTWRGLRWQTVRAALPLGITAATVEARLGPPTARLDLFATASDATTTYLFQPGVYAPVGLTVSVACDFDARQRLLAIRAL